jgi:LPXTG-motif cell wall-anchored protein
VQSPNGVALPKTATDAELRLWFGLLLTLVSLLLMWVWRRRQLAAGSLMR